MTKIGTSVEVDNLSEITDEFDPSSSYAISDKDDDGTPNYYGFVNNSGAWYILKEVVSAGNDSYRYIAGSSDYTTNWTNRDSLSYDYFYNVF